MAATVTVEVEEFWEDLLAFVEEGRVIPVVGPELLYIEQDPHAVPLYRAVADRLLARYGTPPPALENYGLYEAVSTLAAAGRRVRDLYRPVHDILDKLVADQGEPSQPLRQLASIHHFDLYVATTPDDLLARALRAVRSTPPDEIEYAPKLPTGRRRDIPETPTSRYNAVFYLFGRSDVAPFFAIHDEDALEFPYMLQSGNGPERVFSQMRSRNLLLIGCRFGDWLNRFFLRLTNPDRLFSDQRTKKEYLVAGETGEDRDFVMFLERFSQDSRWFPMDAPSFVAELYRRWRERNPSADPVVGSHPAEMSSASGTIFISYSSDDVAAAQLLFEDLQQIGGDVAWFDKSALKPGDDWERHILGAIQKCSLFLPLLSANTQGRDEGYFRLEWHEAAERSKRIEGRKFIFPIVIDADYTGQTGYTRLPERFKLYQFGHAPGGRLSDPLRNELTEELRSLRRNRAS
jgi:hypothetical protein